MSLCLNNLLSLCDACNPFWMAKQAALSLQGRKTHQIGVLKGLVNILRKGMLAFCSCSTNTHLLTRRSVRPSNGLHATVCASLCTSFSERPHSLLCTEHTPASFYSLRSQRAHLFTHSNFFFLRNTHDTGDLTFGGISVLTGTDSALILP